MKQCKVIRGGEGFHGKQGLDYFSGVSAESAGADETPSIRLTTQVRV